MLVLSLKPQIGVLRKAHARAKKFPTKAEQELLTMMKKCKDFLTEVSHIHKGSRLNLRDYITRKCKLVEEKDAIAKNTSKARWRSIA